MRTMKMSEMISFNKDIYKQPKKDLPISMRFLNRKDVCELFHISKTTLYRYEKNLGLPKHQLLNSRKILYKYDELMEWFYGRDVG